MLAYFEKLNVKVDALSLRERVLILIAVLAVVYFIVHITLLSAVFDKQQSIKKQIRADERQSVSMRQQIQAILSNPSLDPDADNRNKLAELKEKQKLASDSLAAMHKQLVSPDRMAGLLKDVLKKNQQLKLIALKTLAPIEVKPPSTPVMVPAAIDSTTSKAKVSLYQHGMELKVQGRYLDLLSYLRTLEALPWHMLWGRISLVADKYPQSTLTITIYTLSLNETWLSL